MRRREREIEGVGKKRMTVTESNGLWRVGGGPNRTRQTESSGCSALHPRRPRNDRLPMHTDQPPILRLLRLPHPISSPLISQPVSACLPRTVATFFRPYHPQIFHRHLSYPSSHIAVVDPPNPGLARIPGRGLPSHPRATRPLRLPPIVPRLRGSETS